MIFARRRVQNALHKLGDDKGWVADNLVKLECSGIRMHSSLCPVGKYLARKFPRVKKLDVGRLRVRVDGKEVETPIAVGRFIVRFDAGGHPELDIKLK